jgi:hypothetical protein
MTIQWSILDRHECVWWSGCIDPHFLDLGTSWRWVDSFTSRPLYPRGESPRYALDRRLGGPLKILCPLYLMTKTDSISETYMKKRKRWTISRKTMMWTGLGYCMKFVDLVYVQKVFSSSVQKALNILVEILRFHPPSWQRTGKFVLFVLVSSWARIKFVPFCLTSHNLCRWQITTK